jgi:hypothetical protein
MGTMRVTERAGEAGCTAIVSLAETATNAPMSASKYSNPRNMVGP